MPAAHCHERCFFAREELTVGGTITAVLLHKLLAVGDFSLIEIVTTALCRLQDYAD